MAKFNSVFTFTGKIGDAHGYTRGSSPGITFIAQNGGPTRQQYLHSKRMIRTRENACEFSGANIAAKLFYRWLPFELRKPFAGSYRTYLKWIIKLIHADTSGYRGRRRIWYTLNVPPHEWSFICVNNNLSSLLFSNLINSIYNFSIAPDRSSCTIDFPNGILPVDITLYPGATDINVKALIIGSSNLGYNSQSKKYLPLAPDITVNIVESGYFQIGFGCAPFSLTPTLPLIPNLLQVAQVILFVSYYENVSGTMNLLDNSGDVIIYAN